jgi:indolepyruvate ferredoxin oxidoreductase beta subunit
MLPKPREQFNLVLSGAGGQGLITLSKIIAQAAFLEKKDVKASELHGLSQRGGSVVVQLRIGKDVFSPLIVRGGADLILVLERNEVLKNCYFATKRKTVFLINDSLLPTPSFLGLKLPSKEKIISQLKGFSKKIIFVQATRRVKKELKKEVLTGIYLASLASFWQLMPIKPKSISRAIDKVIAPQFIKINKKAFSLAQRDYRKLWRQ